LVQLPIRRINFSDPADVARHDQMVAWVEKMLLLQQEKAAADAALLDVRHDLARQIEQLDAQIDALVYELYGLTEEEIAVVEGRQTSPKE
jgi:phosphate uptake regulator